MLEKRKKNYLCTATILFHVYSTTIFFFDLFYAPLIFSNLYQSTTLPLKPLESVK